MPKSTASSSLLEKTRKGNYRDYYVNGHTFTIGMATFAIVVVGGIITLGSMFVAESAKGAQELLPAAPQSLHSNVYGAKHSGVGFANYVVGNEVSKFWTSEMGKKQTQKISDPFASFLLKPKKGAKGARGRTGGANTDEPPEQQADDAQPVDAEHHRIGKARATDAAIQHAQAVAASHVHRGRQREARGGAAGKAQVRP